MTSIANKAWHKLNALYDKMDKAHTRIEEKYEPEIRALCEIIIKEERDTDADLSSYN